MLCQNFHRSGTPYPHLTYRKGDEMGHKKAREFMKKQEIQDAWDNLKTTHRDLYDSVWIPGMGIERMQILYAPSFEEAKWWEVRQLESEWHLFSSKVSEDHVEICNKLIGYEKISFPSKVLLKFFEEACELCVPIKPLIANIRGKDGAVIEFTIFGDLFSRVHFRWWSTYPENWSELAALANKMIKRFCFLK